MGAALDESEVERVYQRFIELADKKKHVYDDDLLALVREGFDRVPSAYELEYLHVSAGTGTTPTATVRLRRDGRVHLDAACGDGPVDAALKTIDRITHTRGRLLDFTLQSVTVGKDAQGEASVRVEFDKGCVLSGKAASTDIVEAGARAYLNCVNRFLAARPRAKRAGKKSGK
jgi:2-isopropylmalate synthase